MSIFHLFLITYQKNFLITYQKNFTVIISSYQLVVTIGYDIENLTDPERRRKYRGEVVKDYYGRQIPNCLLYTSRCV